MSILGRIFFPTGPFYTCRRVAELTSDASLKQLGRFVLL